MPFVYEKRLCFLLALKSDNDFFMSAEKCNTGNVEFHNPFAKMIKLIHL